MTFKELKEASGMNIKQFSEYFNIPYKTVQKWNSGERSCHDYLIDLMHYKLKNEGKV
jgi:DNA-binding transcriptional regulator YiaG